MRLMSVISSIGFLLACESSTGVSQRSKEYGSVSGRVSQDSTQPSIDERQAASNAPWTGIVPDKAVLTTQKIVNNMTFIDTDMSMSSELNVGLAQLMGEAAKVKDKKTQTGFEVVSSDHAYVVVDNTFQIFQDNERFTVINKVLTNTSLKAEIMQLLSDLIQKDPDYAQKTIPSITIITDGDIPSSDQQELATFLGQNFPDGQVYIHLIVSPDTPSSADSWCQPEARPEQLLNLHDLLPKGLRLSICDENWYGHFRNIGKRVIYDQALARIALPISAVGAGAKPYIRFNQQTFPADLIQYDLGSRQIEIKLVDMPSNIQTIEIGFKP